MNSFKYRVDVGTCLSPSRLPPIFSFTKPKSLFWFPNSHLVLDSGLAFNSMPTYKLLGKPTSLARIKTNIKPKSKIRE